MRGIALPIVVQAAASCALPMLALAVALALGACNSDAIDAQTKQSRDKQPYLGNWGVELDAMRPDIDPGDDFYRYVNGRWLDGFVMPEDESRVGSRTLMRDRNYAVIEEMLVGFAQGDNREQLSSVEKKIGDLYASYVDIELRNELGTKALIDELQEIQSIGSGSDLAAVFAGSMVSGGGSPFTGMVETDFNQPDRRVFFLDVAGLGLFGRQIYLGDHTTHRTYREAYRDLVARFLERLEFEEAGELAVAVAELETKIATVHPTADERRDFASSSHSYTLAEVATDFQGFDWASYFETLGIADYQDLLVRFPESIEGIVDIIGSTPLEVWKAYLSFHLLNNNLAYLSDDLRDEKLRVFDAVVSGKTQRMDVEDEAIRFVQWAFGFEIGKLFVECKFSPRAKHQVERIFEHLRSVFRRRLESLQWMDAQTKAEAFAKLDSIRAKIGYPDVWPDEPDIEIRRHDLMFNVRQSRRDRWQRRVQKIGTAPDPEEWGVPPQGHGAGFHPALNEITVPAGNLMPPFFDEFADDAVNYGAIGGVMGHELLHAFDDIGRNFDASGALRDWWTQTSAEEFKRRAQVLVDQFNQYEFAPGRFIDGELKLGENIGDVFGLTIAYDAYRMSLGSRVPEVLDGFTGSQRFFLGWAQMRKAVNREDLQLHMAESDPHSPDDLRVNGVVRNVDAWYAAFDVRPEERMYLPPDQRADLW